MRQPTSEYKTLSTALDMAGSAADTGRGSIGDGRAFEFPGVETKETSPT